MKLQANLLLLLTSVIWGFGFIAQRLGMDHIGPYSFNVFRFLLGALSLVPLVYFLGRKKTGEAKPWLFGTSSTMCCASDPFNCAFSAAQPLK